MFQQIETIDDVLPYTKDRSDISVIEKDGYTVVNYTHQTNDTFNDTPEGLWRREFRGLLFDASGKLISRPFHKFFNMDEKIETHKENVDLSKPHVIQEKMDGSMVRPFYLNGELRWGTKAGITSVADDAEYIFNFLHLGGNEEIVEERTAWIKEQLNKNRTPIFEYIGPRNRIVVSYQEPEIVFLAMRDNRSGEYLKTETPYPGPTVPTYDSVNGSIEDYVAKVYGDSEREGDVIAFADGTRIKIKSVWYVEIHGVKENLEKDRYIASHALHNDLDDMLGVLHPDERNAVEAKADAFTLAYERAQDGLKYIIKELDTFVEAYEGDNLRKAVALDFLSIFRKDYHKYVFAHLDNKDAFAVFEEYVHRQLTKDVNYDRLMEWFTRL